MRLSFAAVRTTTLAFVVAYSASVSAEEPVVTFGESDADKLLLVTGGLYINDVQFSHEQPFWWDRTNLTVSVQSPVNADPANVLAIHDAIRIWSTVLAARLPWLTLTDITFEAPNPKSADIVIHYVPHSGGIVKGGYANCGSQKCLSVVVKSDQPPGYEKKDETTVEHFDPLRVERTALHEIGHALGLGHVVPRDPSLDLMGYGWAYAVPDVPPILSECDLRGIETVFSWFLNGTPPAPSTVAEITC